MTVKKFRASAPGRLDVMGGIADYSGSLVLQMPIQQKTRVELCLRDDYICSVRSTISTGETLSLQLNYQNFLRDQTVDYDFAQSKFKEKETDRWGAYVIGCVLVLQKEKGIDFRGAEMEIQSDVPLGKGVSSSASLEIAVMKVLMEAFNIGMKGTELPVLAQKAENLVAGAPCGLMDQLACYFGEPGKLLPIVCQPDKLEQPVSLPDSISLIGMDSGEQHFVGDASYADVRCAAFMGYTLIAQHLGISQKQISNAKSAHDFSALPFTGYLCNIPVKQFEDSFVHHLPEIINGKEFLERYGGTTDVITPVNRAKNYRVRTCTAHPVYEHERVSRFRQLLIDLNNGTSERENILYQMGDLMYQSHESYSRCGLGSPRTDEIVRSAKSMNGVYGAKITGGGSGGTVCLLIDRDRESDIREWHQKLSSQFNQPLALFI
jgi:galactokinase